MFPIVTGNDGSWLNHFRHNWKKSGSIVRLDYFHVDNCMFHAWSSIANNPNKSVECTSTVMFCLMREAGFVDFHSNPKPS